ncbi:hypothetical protein CspeluHIS016_0407570 [Cutaneotrichosporon spelunceum]|uniref:2-nitropropane dioxygenase n=1 Tax=Cutaneotrichosporon spelunceum TaxID=1672016 RepID=A0AAD3YD91_9TREE|nr:hypothetical protein CspeluHIS016_0407570 [Cutaneotrichosporon spelunceum]
MSLLERIGIKYPIIQAPMAGTATPAMAAAVSNAGALGSIGIGPVPVEVSRQMIRDIRKATDKPFNVNLFVHDPLVPDTARDETWCKYLAAEFDKYGVPPPCALRTGYGTFKTDQAMLAMLLEEKPPVISFHFGLPPPEVIKALKGTGATLFASATSLEEAKACEAAGIDAVVAQGNEAGGHRGIFDPSGTDELLSTSELVSLLTKSIHIPVIAAGGIMDGAGINEQLRLGAVAAQLGTAFINTTESAAPPAHRKSLKEGGQNTCLVAAISGRPARCVESNWTRLLDKLGQDGMQPAAYPNAYDLAVQLHKAASAKGDDSWGPFWAGAGAPNAREMGSAELIEQLLKEMKEAPRGKL